MACLIKDILTDQIIGYKTLSESEINTINAEGTYKATPFYDDETCKRVITNLEGR